MNEWVTKTEKEKAEELAQMEAHQKILEVEENQFQEYVSKVIGEAETRGAPTQVLKKAATVGAGEFRYLGICKWKGMGAWERAYGREWVCGNGHMDWNGCMGMGIWTGARVRCILDMERVHRNHCMRT